MYGDHLIYSWCNTQSVQALSSGEAEFYAILRGGVEALGASAHASELGWKFGTPRVGSDSSAARGVCARKGLGRLKHLELKHVWMQGAVENKRLQLEKERSETNVGDIFTKFLSEAVMNKLLELAGFEYREGRSSDAPQLADLAVRKRVAAIVAEHLLHGM